ncbi:putative HNHc nuclease [Weissella tructae]
MELYGRIVKTKGNYVTIACENAEELQQISRITNDDYPQVLIDVPDQRKVSRLQQKKAHAIIQDIANWSGEFPVVVKEQLKFDFTFEAGIENISLGKSDMTTVRYFITFLLEFCFIFGVPLSGKGLELQDDLVQYMYICLMHRKCALCGQPADVHHIDTVGMGQDRNQVDHRDKQLIALCRIHHQEAHNMGWETFSKIQHVIGIKLSREELHELSIMTYKQMDEHDRKKVRDDQSSRISGASNP